MNKHPSILDAEKKETNNSFYTVVKRNGTLVPFNRERILYAIEAAFRDTKKIPKENPLSYELKKVIEDLTDLIVKKILKLASKGTRLTVEGIQDMVEVTLMKNGYLDIAKDYIIYRDHRKLERDQSLSNLKILRHDKSTLARFNPIKVAASIEKAFRKTQKIPDDYNSPQSLIKDVNTLTEKILSKVKATSTDKENLSVSIIQDFIEQLLMESRFFDVAKDYIIQRAERDKNLVESQKKYSDQVGDKKRSFKVITSENTEKTITERQIKQKIAYACNGFKDLVSPSELFETSVLNFYDGMKEKELDLSNIMAARSKIEKEPAYNKVASRLLLDCIYRETLQLPSSDPSLETSHGAYLKKYIKEGVKLNRLASDLLEFDLDDLANAIDLKRDDLFSYLGLQTLYDRYFIHHEEKRLETPQIFWMRVAMGLAISEKQKNKRAIEFYNILSQFYYVSGTPTLFNAGTTHPQLSSCYLSTISDDLHNIFKVIADDAQLSKWAGGLGNDWTNVRATGSIIKGTNGKSQGVIPFLKVANDTAVAVNQCFAPATKVYTNKGIKEISSIKKGDLVVGISGIYKEVLNVFTYNQQDAMLTIGTRHAVEPICVTAGHPFYAICNIPLKQPASQTKNWLEKGKAQCAWTEASKLKKGDYLALVIPKEVVKVPGFTEADARFYGILLGSSCMTKNGLELKSKNNEHLPFVRNYLSKKNIHFNERTCGAICLQINCKDIVRDATTGCVIDESSDIFPFTYEDLYNDKKQIAPRFSHLPISQTLALVKGMLETSSTISDGNKITFNSTSQDLAEGLRYQLLRLKVPTFGKFYNQNEKVSNESPAKLDENSYDVHIPAEKEIAKLVNCAPAAEQDWIVHQEMIFTRINEVKDTPVTPFVCDLLVEGDESYMTTSALAHNGGKRKGAMCAYLETWHLDIEDFLELRKNTGDERRRTHDMNTANWIPDLFMKRVKEKKQWTLFSPSDVKDLHDLYGKAFEKKYLEYEKMVEDKKIKLFKKVDAFSLWRKMLSMLFETGHPWITFKDPSNIRSPQDHVGVVHSSNLCTEILLNTSKDETAVCNLGSINLAKHVTENEIDEKNLSNTVRTAIRMLDNVIDINFYPIPEAKASNLKHRPIGLGLMGFQDALYIKKLSYGSTEAVEFSDEITEMISYYAILSSSELAEEKGTYSTYKGSKWDRGLLPIDTIDLLEMERDCNVKIDKSSKMNWNVVRDSVKKHGMRNSNTMAIAPTATIANITGITQSIEPMYKHLFVKSNLSGEFTVINPYLVDELKKNNLWDDDMIDDLKYFDGSIAEIERIPDEIKKRFPVAFEIEPEWLIECASRRQKWIDMGQSLNLYLAEPSGKKLSQMYMLAWETGLKTTYYLRSLGATQIEKSSIDVNKRGIQPRWMKNKSASSSIKVDREEKSVPVCNLEEGCESCQ